MTPHEIIIRPVLTEKSAEIEAENNQYTFEVHRAANKIESGSRARSGGERKSSMLQILT